MSALRSEERAQSTSTTAGGYLIPDDVSFYNRYVAARLMYNPMEQSGATILNTSSGNPLPIPTFNDTSNVGALLAENSAVTTQDVTFGQAVLNAYKYTSKLVLVSQELLEDSAVSVDSLLSDVLGQRMGRALASAFTTGDGSSKPSGVVTGSTLGVTAASATALTMDELFGLKHSVDPAYRQGAKWMFNDSTLLAIKKLKDGNGNYIWSSGVALGRADMIDGDPYIVNPAMASIATGNKSVLYGDFSQYFIRHIGQPTLLRLTERYAEYFQVGFVLAQRHDGLLVNAGTNPIKHLLQA